MTKEDWNEFIQKAKDDYYKIGAIPCPAFGGELVYFNRHGWNHLMRKYRKLRDVDQRIRRINLLKYAPQIIAIVRNLADTREVAYGNSHIIFWAAHQKIDGARIRTIIYRRNDGKRHFLSVMEE